MSVENGEGIVGKSRGWFEGVGNEKRLKTDADRHANYTTFQG